MACQSGTWLHDHHVAAPQTSPVQLGLSIFEMGADCSKLATYFPGSSSCSGMCTRAPALRGPPRLRHGQSDRSACARTLCARTSQQPAHSRASVTCWTHTGRCGTSRCNSGIGTACICMEPHESSPGCPCWSRKEQRRTCIWRRTGSREVGQAVPRQRHSSNISGRSSGRAAAE